MTEYGFAQFRERFWEVYSSLCNLSDEEILFGPEEVYQTAYKRLGDLGTIRHGGESRGKIFSTTDSLNVAARLIHIIEMIEQRYELDEARLIAASRDPREALKALPSYPSYLQQVNTESRGAELKRGDRLVFLGSGPLPITLILYYLEHGVESVGIEQNPRYAELSRSILRKLGLADRIKIVEGDHFSLPLVERCELFILAYRAEPKAEIFAHIAKTFKDGSKVAYRIPESGLNGQQTFLSLLNVVQANSYFKSQNLPPDFREYRRIKPQPPVQNTLVLTVKESNNTTT